MGFFREKPVVIEAIQWSDNHRDMFDFLTGTTNQPLTNSEDNFYIDHSRIKGGLVIKTLEGEHVATLGDWIIKGAKGEFYPCEPDIFAATYEEV